MNLPWQPQLLWPPVTGDHRLVSCSVMHEKTVFVKQHPTRLADVGVTGSIHNVNDLQACFKYCPKQHTYQIQLELLLKVIKKML